MYKINIRIREYTENYILLQLIYFVDDKKKFKKQVLLALPNICDVVLLE